MNFYKSFVFACAAVALIVLLWVAMCAIFFLTQAHFGTLAGVAFLIGSMVLAITLIIYDGER